MENVKQTQLQLAVESTSACWAAFVERYDDSWILAESFGLKPIEHSRLLKYVQLKKNTLWLAGDNPQGKPRMRRSVEVRKQLDCRYLYLFANTDHDTHLLVGADGGLDGMARRFFQALTIIVPEAAQKDGIASGNLPGENMVRLVEQLVGSEAAELDLESVIQRSADRARELVRARDVELGLVDARNQVVRILYSEQNGIQQAPYNLEVGSGLLGRIVLDEKPILLENLSAWMSSGLEHTWAVGGSAAGIPLTFKGQVIGALGVYGALENSSFGPEDLQLLKALATQISISIRNARLFQELSERLKAQKLAEKKIAEAARLTAIGEMAANVAHELNNPLTTIAGFTELVLDDVGPDFRQRADLELVLQEARRAREVVRRLLDFSRRGDPRKSPVNINDSVSEIVAMVQSAAYVQDIELQCELWEDLPPVMGDQNQIKQVLLNLVNNGLYAMPNGGKLVIQTLSESRGTDQWVRIRVRDEGTGIPDELLPLIFEPFFTTKPIGSGTGLGLSISKNIIVEHGGDIQVETEIERGSIFSVWLPVTKEVQEVSR